MGIPDDIDFTFGEDGWDNLHLEDVARLEDQIGDKYGAIFLDSITTLLSGQKYSSKECAYGNTSTFVLITKVEV